MKKFVSFLLILWLIICKELMGCTIENMYLVSVLYIMYSGSPLFRHLLNMDTCMCCSSILLMVKIVLLLVQLFLNSAGTKLLIQYKIY